MSAIKWAGLPLIVFTCLFVVSFSYAEYTPTPKVDIAAQGATLQAVMKPLIDKTGTDIFIVQPPKQKVQLTLSQVPIEEAIHRSCKATQASWVRLYVMEKPDAPLDLEEFASINKLATDFRSYVFDNLTDEERGQMRGGGPGGQMGGPGGQPGAGGQPQGGGPGGQMGGRAQWNPSAMFEQLDANKDGKLVKDEVPEQAWARIAQSDTDGNGEVTQDEMTKAFEARAAAGQGQPGAGGQPQGGGPGGQMGGRAQWNPSAMFEQLDANKDGKLVKDEVPEQAWARIAQSDTDGNGEVTQDEMTKAFEARAATGQGQPDAGGQPGQQGAQGGWAGRMGQTQDPNAVPVGLYQAWRELMQTGQLTREDSDRYSMADVLTDLYGGRRTDPATLKLDNASFDDFRKEVLLKTGFTILGDPESLAGTVSLDLTEKSLDEAVATAADELGCKWYRLYLIAYTEPLDDEQVEAKRDERTRGHLQRLIDMPDNERQQMIARMTERIENMPDRFKERMHSSRRMKSMLTRSMKVANTMSMADRAKIAPFLQLFAKMSGG